jgi:hypothetical protein
MKPWNFPRSHHFASRQNKIPDSLTFSRIMACILLSLRYDPDLADKINCLVTEFVWCPLPLDGLSTCLFCLRVNPGLMISEGIGFSSCKNIMQLFLKLLLAIRDEKIFNLRNTWIRKASYASFFSWKQDRLYWHPLKDANVDAKFSFNPFTFFVAILAMICKRKHFFF